MTQPDETHPEQASLQEVNLLLEADRDSDAMIAIQRLAEQTDDPTLRHELNELIASGHASSPGFRRAWDRLQMAYIVGR